MTCPCGTIMCYICRATISTAVGYAHFCQHPRDPGRPCASCKLCSLWTSADEDDKVAVADARRAALAAARRDNPEATESMLKKNEGLKGSVVTPH